MYCPRVAQSKQKIGQDKAKLKAKLCTLAANRRLICPAELDVLAINALCSSILNKLNISLNAGCKLKLDASDCCIGSETLLKL